MKKTQINKQINNYNFKGKSYVNLFIKMLNIK